MTINEYQEAARSTRTGETLGDSKIIYPTLGLTGEAGEVADKVKKIIRDDNGQVSDEKRHAIALEIGDVMWYAAALSDDLGYSLEEVCHLNLEKLSERKKKGKIHGSGDYRGMEPKQNIKEAPEEQPVGSGFAPSLVALAIVISLLVILALFVKQLLS